MYIEIMERALLVINAIEKTKDENEKAINELMNAQYNANVKKCKTLTFPMSQACGF